jgi:hypothetical protein
MAVMESHLDMLEQHPEWKKIYEIMSDNIKSLQKN